jgi:hypothetical protein
MRTAHEQQLHMLWPDSLLASPPTPLIAPGHELRTYRPGDEDGYLEVMHAAGFNGFDEEMVATWVKNALPDGLFFAVERVTGLLVATALATHPPAGSAAPIRRRAGLGSGQARAPWPAPGHNCVRRCDGPASGCRLPACLPADR